MLYIEEMKTDSIPASNRIPVGRAARRGRAAPAGARWSRAPIDRLLRSYQRGMRGLGLVLIILGLPAILGGILLVLLTMGMVSSPSMGGFMAVGLLLMLLVVGLCSLGVVVGVLACKGHCWVNWVVLVLGGLGLLGDLTGMVRDPGFATLPGMIVTAALVVLAVVNLRSAAGLRAAGVDPRARFVSRFRNGGPRARERR